MPQQMLIVDDEPDMLTLLKRSLEPEMGCRVDVAASGEAALEMIRTTDYDLVLADIKMPGSAVLIYWNRSRPITVRQLPW